MKTLASVVTVGAVDAAVSGSTAATVGGWVLVLGVVVIVDVPVECRVGGRGGCSEVCDC